MSLEEECVQIQMPGMFVLEGTSAKEQKKLLWPEDYPSYQWNLGEKSQVQSR